MSDFLKLIENDNVAVALCDVKKGAEFEGITALEDIPKAHKILLSDLRAGDNVIKYGCPIGHITEDTPAGSWVHEHNLKTNLSGELEYQFFGIKEYKPEKSEFTFSAFRRKDGRVGIRNDIWIIPTVGCVNKTAEILAKNAEKTAPCGVFAFTHPYGCSQMETDQENTRKALSALVNHPNAGGVLVVSLGCENTNIEALKPYLGDYDKNRVRFLVTQNCEDEIAEGERLISELIDVVKNDKREEVGIENLVVGYKCGGSDAFSGITANALCGKVNDLLTSFGASTVLTEVPEMFGAEHLLMQRCASKAVFDKTVDLINGYKNYFSSHNVECYENPSPGNHAGGITTLEEKSLGCVQKGGNSVVTDVLSYAENVITNGLNLLWGPGNDIVSTTNLTCSGAHIILFTTGRGTPLGAPVPTIKISSNSDLYNRKPNWIDFNAGELIDNPDFERLKGELFKLILEVANGKLTKNELNSYREISIFKDGVVL